VVHDAIRGVVSTMSPSSLTVRAADGFSETFLLSSVTRVRVRPGGAAPGRGRHASLSRISRGEQVFAIGKAVDRTGSLPTARLVIVGVKR
jgi:hypothetical protein